MNLSEAFDPIHHDVFIAQLKAFSVGSGLKLLGKIVTTNL